MDDCLQNARFIHLVIIGICATIIVFAISPRQTTTYGAAIRELKQLEGLDLNALHSYVRQAVAEDDNQDFKILVENFAQQAHVSISDTVNLNTVATLPYIFKYPPMSEPLVEVEKYFKAEHQIFVFRPDAQELKEQLNQVVSSIASDRQAALSKTFVLTKVDLNNEQSRIEDLQKDVDDYYGDPKGGIPSTATFEVEIKSDTGYSSRLQRISGRLFPLNGNGFKQWFLGQEQAKQLVGPIPGSREEYRILFPNLRPVWNEVLTATPDSALVLLEDKRKKAQQQVSFLGLTVDEGIVVVVGPIAVLLTTIYLLVYVKHIRTLADRNREKLLQFGWVGLFPDRLSEALTYSSIVLLPLLANSMLLIRAWTSARFIEWLAAVSIILTAVCSISLITHIKSLKRQMRESSQGATGDAPTASPSGAANS
jgi:hypothetical protein